MLYFTYENSWTETDVSIDKLEEDLRKNRLPGSLESRVLKLSTYTHLSNAKNVLQKFIWFVYSYWHSSILFFYIERLNYKQADSIIYSLLRLQKIPFVNFREQVKKISDRSIICITKNSPDIPSFDRIHVYLTRGYIIAQGYYPNDHEYIL